MNGLSRPDVPVLEAHVKLRIDRLVALAVALALGFLFVLSERPGSIARRRRSLFRGEPCRRYASSRRS